MLMTLFSKRFEELQAQSDGLPFYTDSNSNLPHAPVGDWQKWATSVQHLIKAVFGEGSPHYVNFTGALSGCMGFEYQIKPLQGIFESAKEDFDGGYVFNVDLTRIIHKKGRSSFNPLI